jgi:hypothetical protein
VAAATIRSGVPTPRIVGPGTYQLVDGAC